VSEAFSGGTDPLQTAGCHVASHGEAREGQLLLIAHLLDQQVDVIKPNEAIRVMAGIACSVCTGQHQGMTGREAAPAWQARQGDGRGKGLPVPEHAGEARCVADAPVDIIGARQAAPPVFHAAELVALVQAAERTVAQCAQRFEHRVDRFGTDEEIRVAPGTQFGRRVKPVGQGRALQDDRLQSRLAAGFHDVLQFAAAYQFGHRLALMRLLQPMADPGRHGTRAGGVPQHLIQ